MYHDLPGLATTTLAADVQTSGAAAAGELQQLLSGMIVCLCSMFARSEAGAVVWSWFALAVHESTAGVCDMLLVWFHFDVLAAGASDMLVVLRVDSQRRGAPVAANNPAVVSDTPQQQPALWPATALCCTLADSMDSADLHKTCRTACT